MTPLRIAMLHVDLPPIGRGGVAYQVDLLAATLVARGHEVTVFSTEPLPVEPRPYRRVGVVASGRWSRRLISVGRAFAALDLSGFDVVHAHGDDWAVSRGTPRVRTFYGTALLEARSAVSWPRRCAQLANYGLEWVSAARASESVVISQHTRRFLPMAREHIPCAFDPRTFFPGSIQTDEPSILFVAGLIGGRKRGELMLEVFTEVRRLIPELKLHVVSRDSVSRPGVIGHDSLVPADLADLYRSCWVLCSTSSYEGFGVPYIEAMASGLPVIATDNPGAQEVLQRGRLGVICEPEVLVNELVLLLSDSSRRQGFTLAGLKAAPRYSADAVAAKYEDLYRRVTFR